MNILDMLLDITHDEETPEPQVEQCNDCFYKHCNDDPEHQWCYMFRAPVHHACGQRKQITRQ